MAAYTTLTKVKAEIPSGLPEGYTQQTWDALLTGLITDNSQYVDDNVGGRYGFNYNSSVQKFPDITDSPATPATIEKICRFLCAADAYAYITRLFNNDDNKRQFRRNWAEGKLEEIREGVIQISVAGENISTVAAGSVKDFEENIFTEDTLESW
jgi:hypothetical protein